MTETRLTADDLIRDEPLDRIAGQAKIDATLDLLNHRGTARRVSQLVDTQTGHLNVAVYGPWGSGKSSFFGLLTEEISNLSKDHIVVRFDAWQNSGPGFHANFLSSLAKQIPGAPPSVDEDLFTTKKTMKLPFGLDIAGKSWARTALIALALVSLVIFVVPLAWSALLNGIAPVDDFAAFYRENTIAWVGLGASGTVAFVIVMFLLDLAKVSVDTAEPSHVAQFRSLFDTIVSRGKNRRFVILVDELDRCAPEDVIATLEGLRTFLGHDRCVFVVAFDRAAVSETIRTHLRHTVPVRADAGYYSTAGEYLDKIFQFQVTLPPQPRHVSRRYAMSLVKDKSGVWETIDTANARKLERVVSILSPIHVRSPRRTKVLLNDFAVNARIYESLGFDWLNRAEELAAWTVIQTEFPNLADDLEREPALIRALAHNVRPSREQIARLFDAYRSNKPLDEVVEEAASGAAGQSENAAGGSGDSETTDPSPAGDLVATNLRDSLDHFLDRLIDMGCRLPTADLILQHSGEDLLRFDDLEVYNTVIAAGDSARSETMATLERASEPDRIAAVEFMLESLETSLTEEAQVIRSVVGALALSLSPESLSPLDARLRQAWDAAHSREETRLLEGATIAGYARAYAGTRRADIERFIDEVRRTAPKDMAVALVQIMAEAPEGRFRETAEFHLDQAIGFARSDPDYLAAVLQKIDQLDSTAVDSSGTEKLAVSLSVTAPEAVKPANTTAAAVSAATAANEKAEAEFDDEVMARQSDVNRLLSIWPNLQEASPVKSFLLSALRKIEPEDWALDRHDDLIQNDLDRGFASSSAAVLLESIVDVPSRAAGRWAHMIPSGAAVPPELLASAIETVVTRGTTTFTTDSSNTNAALNLRAIMTLKPEEGQPMDVTAAIERLATSAEESERVETVPLLRALLDLIRGLAPAAPTRESMIQIEITALATAAAQTENGDPRIEVILGEVSTMESITARGFRDVARQLHESAAPDNLDWRVRLVVALDRRLVEMGEQIEPLTVERLTEVTAANAGDVVKDWIRSAPDGSAVLQMVSEFPTIKIGSGIWAAYSRLSQTGDRDILWRHFEERGDLRSAKAVAAEGISAKLYGMVAGRLIGRSSMDDRRRDANALMSLPQAAPAYRQAVLEIVAGLAKDARKGDLSYIAVPLVETIGKIRPKEAPGVRKTLGPWVQRYPGHLSKRQIDALIQQGALPARDRRSFLPPLVNLFGR